MNFQVFSILKSFFYFNYKLILRTIIRYIKNLYYTVLEILTLNNIIAMN